MNRKNGTGTGMFLMEMIVVVFFFTLCAGICMKTFVKADEISRLSRDTGEAVILAENLAEIWKSGGENLVLEKQKEFSPDFSSKISFSEKDGLETAHIVIVRVRDERELFSLDVARYVPEKRQGEAVK